MKNIKIFYLVIGILIIALAIGGYFILKSNQKQEFSQKDNLVTSEDIKEENTKNENETSSKKTAVIYFSATGNTKQIAEYIKDEINSDIFEIIPKQKYTSEDLNYGDNSTRATKEQNDENARPEIANKIDVSNYDVIFLGYPIWWGNVPKIILTFMDNTNLNGKTVIPFCTSGSSGISTSENTLKSYNSNINWVTGNRFSGSSTKSDIKNWIDELDLKEKQSNLGDEISMSEFIIEVNKRELIVKVEDNSSSKALLERLKDGNIIVNAHDYSNFEKVGELGFGLPTNDKQITTKPGDVILYQGNNICLYYGTNTWNFTKIGEVINADDNELKSILGGGNVTLTLKLK